MEYIRASEKDAQSVFELVQYTIMTVYSKYYPKEVVEFFCELHSRENISEDIKSGHVGILVQENSIVGTGSYKDNHITRVYVSPKFQGQGYGSYIMGCLEKEIGEKYTSVYLDASLPASRLYEKRGYKTLKHEKYMVKNGAVLIYEVMEKKLHSVITDINYDGKFFVPQFNTENGGSG